jgi:predicted metalloenzyme YecM
MSRTWVYLKPEEYSQYKRIAEDMDKTESELTQLLIRMFLNIPKDKFQPNICIHCRYYQIATNNAIQAFMTINKAFSLVTPSYLIKK